MEGSMESTIVTSLVKTLKVMQRMEESQKLLMTNINDVKDTQSQSQQTLSNLDDKVSKALTKQDFDVVVEDINNITSKLNELDNIKDELIKIVKTNNSEMKTSIDMSTADIKHDIAESNNKEIMQVIDSLVQGLSNMHKNMVQLAKRVETLSENVQTGIESTNDLSNTIIDNNARVKSMDMRMAAFMETEIDGQKSDKSLEDDINFLKQFSTEK